MNSLALRLARPLTPAELAATRLCAALIIVGTLTAGPVLRAQVILHDLASPDGEPYGRFGSAVAGVGDLDGDGVPDLLVGAWGESPGTSPDVAGRAYALSGADRSVLHTLASPNEQESGGFGFSVAGVPDADGDGVGDLLVGAVGESPGPSPNNAGRVYLYSGATGALLRTLASPSEQAGSDFG